MGNDFTFRVVGERRFVEVVDAWVGRTWPMPVEEAVALCLGFGWEQSPQNPRVFTSDAIPDEVSSFFTHVRGFVNMFTMPVTDIADEGSWDRAAVQARAVFERFAGLLGEHYGVAPALEVDDDGGSRSAEFFLPNGVYLDLGANQGSVSLVLYSPEEARFLREEQERQSLGMPAVDS